LTFKELIVPSALVLTAVFALVLTAVFIRLSVTFRVVETRMVRGRPTVLRVRLLAQCTMDSE
jgi:hypothetical protein